MAPRRLSSSSSAIESQLLEKTETRNRDRHQQQTEMEILTLLFEILSFLEFLSNIIEFLFMIYAILGFVYGQENGHVNRGVQIDNTHADVDDHHHRDDQHQMSANTHICSFCEDGWTNIRCSRCKVARYCSGECQINHWRAGHKFECKEYKSPANVDSESAISSEGVGTSHIGISKSDHYRDRDQDQMPSTSASSYHCLSCGDDRAGIRCARCKVARYCSGKCQINHWRAGHKFECKEYKSPANVDSETAISSEGVGTSHIGISKSDHYRDRDRDQMPSTSASSYHCLSCGDDRADNCCSRCKVARYCSRKCQKQHWRAGHRFECKNYNSSSNIDSASIVSEIRGSDHMGRNRDQRPTAPASRDFCFVCGDWSDIRCSRCKAVRYCSQACETKHWREGHKLECKENKSPAKECGGRGLGHVGRPSSMYHKSKKDGKLADTVQSPKRTSNEELPSVEECPICFSTIHTSEPSCPLLACHICKNKFHSTCLLKWFSTSNKSRCPLCQSPFSNQKMQQ